ncbi:hypothetical protein HHK36_028073 [Tetracentron sinense]|uniref:Polycomb protein VEFS-Box domain-containing protein n=1 Tax=Tetracentron sinense TaxID=13715 RepID=A0A834YHS0_TETSI|nr:hypothetical protein HHK36_028073 [Tetracentron sinense]
MGAYSLLISWLGDGCARGFQLSYKSAGDLYTNGTLIFTVGTTANRKNSHFEIPRKMGLSSIKLLAVLALTLKIVCLLSYQVGEEKMKMGSFDNAETEKTFAIEAKTYDIIKDTRQTGLGLKIIEKGKGFAVEVWRADSLASLPRRNPQAWMDPSGGANIGGYCLWGKIPMESLYLSWENCVKLSLGHRAEVMSTVNMHSCFLESSQQQVQVDISAQEIGANEKSPYNSYTYNDVPTSSLSHIIRLRTGNVIFNYRYYNNTLQKTEGSEISLVTEEYQAVNVAVKTDSWRSEIVADGVDPRPQTFFYCSKPHRRRRPKNLVQNAKHVHPHVLESVSNEVAREGLSKGFLEKNDGTVIRTFSMGEDGEEAVHLPVSYMRNISGTVAVKKRRLKVQLCVLDARTRKGEKAPKSFPSENDLQNAKHKAENNGPGNPSAAECMEHLACGPNVTGVPIATALSSVDPECFQSVSGSIAPPAMLQFAKTRKLSFERSDPRNRALLQKRQFFHSHRAQLLPALPSILAVDTLLNSSFSRRNLKATASQLLGNAFRSGTYVLQKCVWGTIHRSFPFKMENPVEFWTNPPGNTFVMLGKHIFLSKWHSRVFAFVVSSSMRTFIRNLVIEGDLRNPMELEQVLSDRDSEDEVDDDIADFEDRRMLDDFVDVTKDEKQIMHLWNSFVRKQRVLADGHIPWACEAFSKLHGQDLVQAPALIW